MLLREILIISKLCHRKFIGALRAVLRENSGLEYLGKAGMGRIHTYFGFKNGKLVSVLQSINGDAKKALDCTYYVAEPQDVEKQIEKWKKEKSE